MKLSKKYKVLITTSGVSQRLGELTKYTNQSLVRLLKKPIISHIVESYPPEVEIVVTIGHFGNLVKEFLELAYPERKFTFVVVDKYQGEGSSLVYSMLCAKEYLQCPFIFHAGDTVVKEDIPIPLKVNWCGGFRGQPNANYRSFIELDEKVLAFRKKGVSDFDFLHIGLIGIKDYVSFWRTSEELYSLDSNNQALGDVPVLSKMIKEGAVFHSQEFKTWLDIGSVESLYKARETFGDYLVNLDKSDEATFIFDEEYVIKFMATEETVVERVKRADYLKGLVPEVMAKSAHFYKYKFALGRLYSRVVNPHDFRQFLDWTKRNLWQKKKEVSNEEFKNVCLDFYKNKTLKRVQQFYELTGIKDELITINGQEIPPLSEVLNKLDFDWLAQGQQGGFHGDCILDNIIRTRDSYVFLDWRQNFGGLLKTGDIYYDLIKLNHNLTINHDIVFNNQFSIKVRGDMVICDIMRSENLVSCQKVLWDFIENEGFDLKKVKILTAIAWLNMSPLHHHPYNYFLYYFGRLNLWQILNQ